MQVISPFTSRLPRRSSAWLSAASFPKVQLCRACVCFKGTAHQCDNNKACVHGSRTRRINWNNHWIPRKYLVVLCANLDLSKDEIIQIITMVVDWHFPVVHVASTYHITSERVYQLVQNYRKTGIYPVPKRLGLPPNVPSPATHPFLHSSGKGLSRSCKSCSA